MAAVRAFLRFAGPFVRFGCPGTPCGTCGLLRGRLCRLFGSGKSRKLTCASGLPVLGISTIAAKFSPSLVGSSQRAPPHSFYPNNRSGELWEWIANTRWDTRTQTTRLNWWRHPFRGMQLPVSRAVCEGSMASLGERTRPVRDSCVLSSRRYCNHYGTQIPTSFSRWG